MKLIIIVVLHTISLFSISANALNKSAALDLCLNQPATPVFQCINKLMTKKTIQSCYSVVDKVYSNTAKERLKDYCFFNISEFPNLNYCISSAEKFYSAESRDEGLFECYIQFSSRINNRTCFQIAKKMSLQNKKNHLARQCENR